MKIGTRSLKKSHGPISLSMTSMIDATFLLLSYFIFTTSVGEHEAHLIARAAAVHFGEHASALSPQNVDVQRDATGMVYLIGARELRSKGELTQVLRKLPTEAGVAIRVHPGPDVDAVAAALQAAHDAGFQKVSYVSLPR